MISASRTLFLFLTAFLSAFDSHALVGGERPTKGKEAVSVFVDAFAEKSVVQKSLEISNLTGSKARITNVKSSCGCMIASFPKTEVQSEGRISLVLALDASSTRATYSAQLVIVWSNQAISEVEVKVSQMNLLVVNPQIVHMDPLSNEPTKVAVSIVNLDIDPSLLTVSISDETGINLAGSRVEPSKAGWVIALPHLSFSDREKLHFFRITVSRSDGVSQTRYLVCKNFLMKQNAK